MIKVNEKQRTVLFDKIRNYYKGDLKGKTIALWGLAFKPNTDDIREAPALYIIEKLLKAGAIVQAFDPEAMENVEKLYGDKIAFANDQYEVLNNANALMILTEWNEFRSPDFNFIKSKLIDKAIFDGRNIFDPATMQQNGFYFESIGRP